MVEDAQRQSCCIPWYFFWDVEYQFGTFPDPTKNLILFDLVVVVVLKFQD
jgi:hypothetical protein